MHVKRWLTVNGIAAALLAGCADPQIFAPIGQPFDTSMVPFIQDRFTTRWEIEGWLGQPVAHTTLVDVDGFDTGDSRASYLHGESDTEGFRLKFLELQFDDEGVVMERIFVDIDEDPPD